jgi:hypothetical protein
MFSTQLNSGDIIQTFPLGSDFPFFRMLSVTNRKCCSCIFNSGTKSLLRFGLGDLYKTRFLASGSVRNPTVQYAAGHCSLPKFLFRPLAISLMAFLVMCVHFPVTKREGRSSYISSLTFSFQVSSISATPLLGGVNRSFTWLLNWDCSMRWHYCAVVTFRIFISHQLIKLVPRSVCLRSFIFFFGFQIVSCSRMKGKRNPIFKMYLKRYMPFGKIYAAYRRRWMVCWGRKAAEYRALRHLTAVKTQLNAQSVYVDWTVSDEPSREISVYCCWLMSTTLTLAVVFAGDKLLCVYDNRCRVQLKCDGTRWRTGREVKGKLANGVGSSTLHTTSEHGVSSNTTAYAHTSAASSRLHWRPRRFKWTHPFRRKTKSGFCACAITFQTQSTSVPNILCCSAVVYCSCELMLMCEVECFCVLSG